ncbi:MAG: OstA-like protein [Bacteroidia bacterium]|nr:hypothetical protein [Bacteroidia bacterium]MDW8158480.1 OstA-like protein [Bacteroidia bacterium]
MYFYFRFLYFLVFISLSGSILIAQNTRSVQVVNADILEIAKTPEGELLRKLVGNVVLQQDTTFLFCDSAYYFTERNFIEAYSKVKILIGKNISIQGDKLSYDGNSRIAELYHNVLLTHKHNQLKTHRLTYYRAEGYAVYREGGTLSDSENELSSKQGYYYTRSKIAYFYQKVVMKGKNFQLTTDSLKYIFPEKKAIFIAPTFITTTDNQEIYTERGHYLSTQKEAFLYQNSILKDSTYTIKADTIFYQDSLQKGWFHCAVSIRRDSSLSVYGERAWLDRKLKELKITENSYLVYYFAKDTLVLFGDTLYSRYDTLNRYQRLRAYPTVRLTFGSVLAIADSLEYNFRDSTLKLMQDPVLWSENYQLSGDTIILFFRGNTLDSLVIPSNSWGIQQEDSVFFNQIKAKTLIAKLRQNQIYYLYLNGNCESIYIVKDGSKYLGLNKSLSKEMKIFFRENKPSRVVFMQKPQATFFPIYQVWKKNHLLPGFEWRQNEKPSYYLGSKALAN